MSLVTYPHRGIKIKPKKPCFYAQLNQRIRPHSRALRTALLNLPGRLCRSHLCPVPSTAQSPRDVPCRSLDSRCCRTAAAFPLLHHHYTNINVNWQKLTQIDKINVNWGILALVDVPCFEHVLDRNSTHLKWVILKYDLRLIWISKFYYLNVTTCVMLCDRCIDNFFVKINSLQIKYKWGELCHNQ